MDDLSDLDDEFQERLKNYFATTDWFNSAYGEPTWQRGYIMAEKEACFDRGSYVTTPEAAPLEDPWFWPNDEQPINRADELEPFWR